MGVRDPANGVLRERDGHQEGWYRDHEAMPGQV